jgi:Concanavalin A-like lectin/glucanases superfamily
MLKRYLACALLALSITPAITAAQEANGGLFCTAGLHPDGFIDLTKLPPAPFFPNGPGGGPLPSAPISVTLAVTGIPGLTAQVNIPALQPTRRGPVYSLVNGALQFNGFPSAGYSVMFQFNNPVLGVGVVGYTQGRSSGFSISTGPPSNVPANFVNTISTFNLAPYNFYAAPLQQVNMFGPGGFQTAYVLAEYTGYGLPSIANVRVQSASASDAGLVPKEGLQQWLSSDAIASPFSSFGSWPDQSGNGHDATQTASANQPGYVQQDGNHCQPALAFAGNQYLNFNLPIDGWQQMTVFLVAKSTVTPPTGSYASFAAAMLWNENANWGNTFVSPYQTSEAFRFGTKQTGNQPIYTRPKTMGQDFTVTRAVHDNSTDSLYVDGLLVLRQGNKLPVLAGTSGAGYLGRGINNTYYNGEISEVLVYNRVLTVEEAASVESYLRNKFGTR